MRITAQLIKADDGTHVWTESYDRELTDVFVVQEDIAPAIAGALRVPLGLQQGERLVSNRTDDVESYQQYLRARALYRARAIESSHRRAGTGGRARSQLCAGLGAAGAGLRSRSGVRREHLGGIRSRRCALWCNPRSTKRKWPRGKPFAWTRVTPADM